MALNEEIKQQLLAANIFDFWFNDKKIAPLNDLLNPEKGEIIEYAATGIDEKNATVLLICTNKRFIVLANNMFKGERAKSISLSAIKSVMLKQQLVYDDLTLIQGNRTIKFNSINKASASVLAKTIKNWIQKIQSQDRKNNDINKQVEQIKEIKKLLDEGILTQKEFEAKKKQILGI